MGVTFADLLRQGAARLSEDGLENARGDAKLLLLAAAGFSGSDFILREHDVVPDDVRASYEAMITRRAEREPVSKILGVVEFFGHTFRTDSRALAPRQDSERLVEAALEGSAGQSAGRVIDFGTGSGCLLLSFLKERPAWQGLGVDISPDALSLARENADHLSLQERVRFLEGSWAVAQDQLAEIDLVISNPPYIPTGDLDGLDPEVRRHDPALALDGGSDGLNAYRDLLILLSEGLRPGVPVLFEIGFDQAELLKSLAEGHGFAEFTVRKDFSGHNRVVGMVQQ